MVSQGEGGGACFASHFWQPQPGWHVAVAAMDCIFTVTFRLLAAAAELPMRLKEAAPIRAMHPRTWKAEVEE